MYLFDYIILLFLHCPYDLGFNKKKNKKCSSALNMEWPYLGGQQPIQVRYIILSHYVILNWPPSTFPFNPYPRTLLHPKHHTHLPQLQAQRGKPN